MPVDCDAVLSCRVLISIRLLQPQLENSTPQSPLKWLGLDVRALGWCTCGPDNGPPLTSFSRGVRLETVVVKRVLLA
jgi:hypothetical protein